MTLKITLMTVNKIKFLANEIAWLKSKLSLTYLQEL